jgi:hypothetical protein
MSESHDTIFSCSAILLGKHQGLDLSDQQLLNVMMIEAKLPEILAEAIKSQTIIPQNQLKKLIDLKIRPSLETPDNDAGANGEFLTRLLAFIEKLLPLILPLFVKSEN